MVRSIARSVALALACIVSADLAWGQESRASKSVRAVRTDRAPKIDGRLDEPVWQTAGMIDDFRQARPMEDVEPSERTEIRFLYDDEALYVGVRCFDGEPEGIISTRLARDAELFSDDEVSLYFGTFHNQRDGYEFSFNPTGGRSDALLVQGSRRPIREWDGIFYSDARIDAQGWVVEFALPFKTISFDPQTDVWDFNASRSIKRKGETVRWAAPYFNKRASDLGVAGDLTGLRGMKQGLGLDVAPYAKADFSHDEVNDDDARFTGGFDVKYQFTPSLVGVFTVNTDFAATEVDDRRVNLTRFPLFFPEKRDFFLQDAGIFQFGGLQRDPIPFFSRRIGINDGDPVDLLAGAKVTGRTGDFNVGFLDVQMDEFGSGPEKVDSKNLAVGRLSYNLLEESSIGAIVTNGDPSTNGDNTVYGLDFNYRDSSFNGTDEVVEGHLWFQQSADSVEGTGEAFGVRMSYPNDTWSAGVGFEQVGESYYPDLGFVRQRGVRGYDAQLRYRYRTGNGNGSSDLSLQSIESGVFAFVTTDLDDQLDNGRIGWNFLELRDKIGDDLELNVGWNKERLDEDFEIDDGVVIPTGVYTWHRLGAEFRSASARPIGFDLDVSLGDFFNGTRLEVDGGLQLRPSDRLNLGVSYEFNEVDLPGGSFETHVVRFPLRVFFSPCHTLSVFTQFDNGSDEIDINARFRWIIEEGNDLFVVFNHGYLAGAGHYHPTETAMVLKLGWTFRF